MKYEVYPDRNNEWRWRLKAANGQNIATSGEGYTNKSDCYHGISLVKGSSAAPIEEVAIWPRFVV